MFCYLPTLMHFNLCIYECTSIKIMNCDSNFVAYFLICKEKLTTNEHLFYIYSIERQWKTKSDYIYMNTYYLGTFKSRFILHSTFPILNIMYYLRVMQYSKKIDLKIIRSYIKYSLWMFCYCHARRCYSSQKTTRMPYKYSRNTVTFYFKTSRQNFYGK